MPLSRQSEKIKMLNQAVSDLQAQIIAKDKQIAFLQGQIYNYKWIIKNTNTDGFIPGEDFGEDIDFRDNFLDT